MIARALVRRCHIQVGGIQKVAGSHVAKQQIPWLHRQSLAS